MRSGMYTISESCAQQKAQAVGHQLRPRPLLLRPLLQGSVPSAVLAMALSCSPLARSVPWCCRE